VRIVEAVLRGRSVIRERALAPVVNAKGDPVLGPDGRPVMAWQEREQQRAVSLGRETGFRIRAFGIEIDLAG
jgi:hypothetical protein